MASVRAVHSYPPIRPASPAWHSPCEPSRRHSPAAGPAAPRNPVFARIACAPARARYAAARLVAPARARRRGPRRRPRRRPILRPCAKARRSAQVSRRFASGRESRRPASRSGRQGGPAPCVMACHVLSWPPCGEPVATRQFGNGGIVPPGFSGMDPSFRALFAPCARRRPGRAVEPCFARIACAPARARYAAARLIAPAPAREAQGFRTSRWNRASGLRPRARGSRFTEQFFVTLGTPASAREGEPQRARLPSVRQFPRKPPARPCSGTLFRAYRVRARPCALRGGAPDCARARAREGPSAARPSPAGLPVAAKAAGLPAARPGREAPRPVSWRVMFCHGVRAGSS